MTMKMDSRIRSSHNKAKSGDAIAAFSLYQESLSHSEFPIAVEECRQLLINSLKNKRLYLKRLQLEGYKQFKSLKIDIRNSNCTVFVGDNGAGKSSLLDAIGIALTWIVSAIRTDKPKGHSIEGYEINASDSVGIAKIITLFYFGSSTKVNLSLHKAKVGHEGEQSSLKEIRELGSLYKFAREEIGDFNLPFFGYYTVNRSLSVNEKTLTNQIVRASRKLREDRFTAYDNAFDGSSNFDYFSAWFRELFDIISGIKSKISLTTQEIQETLESGGQEALIEKLNNINVPESIEQEHFDKASKHISSVITAIKNAIPEIEDMYSSRGEQSGIIVRKSGVELNITQLSQGEKTLIGLVGDIARRLTTLNPKSSKPFHSDGIILIDEVDLHLHPSWQREITYRLSETFPKIQFILSTHSPIVCTTVKHSSLYKLVDRNIYAGPKGSKGASQDRMLKSLFDVPLRPNDENTVMLHEYMNLVYEDKWTEAEALRLRKVLDKEFEDEDPTLMEADIYIESREWELLND